MAYAEQLAQRIRQLLAGRPDIEEKKMFGGIAFMARNYMACGVNGDELMVRIGPDRYEELLQLPHAREMDFTGRALKGMLYIDAAGIDKDEDLRAWLQRSLDFVDTLPPKKPNKKKT